MRIPYPAIRPYSTHYVEVDSGHRLYVEQCGNPDGLPVVFFHGGPGGGCRDQDRCFFDPERYRIVLFDQRGSGRSTPHAGLAHNTTDHLLADIETVRELLAIDQWLVFGGSWGSTLALLYAQAHPQQVLGLVLRGIFLCRERDIRWFYQSGARHVYPDYWKDFESQIPPHLRDDMVSAYHGQLTGDNEIERMGAAKAWSVWEGRCSTLNPNPAAVAHFADPHFALAFARIESHYFINQCFIRPNQILEDAHRLASIPGIVIHGRYDMVCPVEQAAALVDRWPGARLEIIRDAGHSSSEPGITDALIRATDHMASFLGGPD